MKHTLVMILALMLAGCNVTAFNVFAYDPYAAMQPTSTQATVTPSPFSNRLDGPTPTPEKVQLLNFCTVTAYRLYVRSGPGTNYPAVSWLRSGETVSITTQAGNWYKIPAGWIHKSYCEKE